MAHGHLLAIGKGLPYTYAPSVSTGTEDFDTIYNGGLGSVGQVEFDYLKITKDYYDTATSTSTITETETETETETDGKDGDRDSTCASISMK